MTKIVEHAAARVESILTKELGQDFLYHNLRHTKRVVASAQEILESTDVSKEEKEKVILAAWFHDTGYTKNIEKHEEESCQIAIQFLEDQGKPTDFNNDVCALIMATERFYEPKNELEEIIRDADAAHLAQKDFRAISEMLREELSKVKGQLFTNSEWRDENVKMFQSEHRFYTGYAKENWQQGKDKNLKRLVKARKKDKRLIKKEKLKAKYKGNIPDRGVQTLFRTTLRNHIKLSDIADTKSNILLSVNAIIISLALSNLIPKLDNPSNDYLIIPTLIFIVFSVVSMVMSIIATRPNVTSGTFTMEDVRNKKVNLLFFGNFHKMSLRDYETAMEKVLRDQDYIYSSLTKDLYYLGVVLEKKYRILRWTYTIFMIGMIVSVIAFGIALKFYGPERIMDVM